MYTYRKPKNAKHAIELVKMDNINTNWDICDQNDLVQSQKYFDMYQPIVFIYKDDKLIASAHNKNGGRPTIYDLNNRDITNSYNKLVIREIDIELRQLELF
jgi:alpha-L-fucosidase